MSEEEKKLAQARLADAAPEMFVALEDLKKELWRAGLKLNIRKHFNLLNADAGAGNAIYIARNGVAALEGNRPVSKPKKLPSAML